MNKERLLKFLPRFLEDRQDDDQFTDEKAWLVKAIGNLPDSVSALAPPTGGAQVQQQTNAASVRS